MNAKEMFEELGYVKYNCSDSSGYDWQKPAYDNKKTRNIHFDKENKTIGIMGGHVTNSIGMFGEDWLTVEEFKAIHQQLIELGWI